jgi:hypothetical protein
MRTVFVTSKGNQGVVKFEVARQHDGVRFTEIEGAVKQLGELYKNRFKIKNRKFVDKTIMSKEFGR